MVGEVWSPGGCYKTSGPRLVAGVKEKLKKNGVWGYFNAKRLFGKREPETWVGGPQVGL